MPVLSLAKILSPSLPIPGAEPWYAAPQDPALSVMTDFRERSSVTVADTDRIGAALEHMKHTGVRCAFAIDTRHRVVVGMITAYDITGERPMRHVRDVGGKHDEILVRDIMQPLAEVKVVDIGAIERATVASVARLLEESRLSHIPVMETSANGERRLRGLLSAAKIKRLLSKP
ncbi:MAG: CBS domain-containing protein [Steroidobacteraceae bacterium]